MDPKKEKILNDWLAVRNSILRASEGEMKITYARESDVDKKKKDLAGTDKDLIVGVFVDLVLRFPKPLTQEFTEEEKKAVEEALRGDKKEENKEKGK